VQTLRQRAMKIEACRRRILNGHVQVALRLMGSAQAEVNESAGIEQIGQRPGQIEGTVNQAQGLGSLLGAEGKQERQVVQDRYVPSLMLQDLSVSCLGLG